MTTTSRQPVPLADQANAASTAGENDEGQGRGRVTPALTDEVPFITGWTGEAKDTSTVVPRRDGRGIRYADERPHDRVDGVLWRRAPSRPGKGKPDWGMVHSLRQRLAMTELLCQVCGKPADLNADGVLWLVDATADDLRPGGELTAHPPVCLPCAQRAVDACPHLRKSWVALRVHGFVPCAVKGELFSRSRPVPVALDAGVFAFDHPLLPWVRASQLIMHLSDFTVITL